LKKTSLPHWAEGVDAMETKTDTLMLPEVQKIPSRFRNAIGKYRVTITKECNNCGICVKLCPYGVYKAGSKKPRVAAEHLSLGSLAVKMNFTA
jgi:ferredoxin